MPLSKNWGAVELRIYFFCKSEFLHAYHSHLTSRWRAKFWTSFRRLQEPADSPLSTRRVAQWNPAVMFHMPQIHVTSSVWHRWLLGQQTGCAGWQHPRAIMRHGEPKSWPGDVIGSHDPFALFKKNGACMSRRRSPGWWSHLAAS